VAAAARGTAFEWRLRENPLVWSPWRDVRPTSRGSGSFRRRKAAAAASLADATPPDAPEEAPCPRPLPRPPAILVGGSQRKPSATCTYVRQHAAAGATFLADLFMRNLDARDGAFNVLHIRRNDKADPRVCNTSVARAVQVARILPRREAVVVFTDERDPVYLAQLVAALREGLSGARVVLGESLMTALAAELDSNGDMRGADNFLVFAAELEIYARAGSSMHVCTACPQGEDASGCARYLQYVNVTRTLYPGFRLGLAPHWLLSG